MIKLPIPLKCLHGQIAIYVPELAIPIVKRGERKNPSISRARPLGSIAQQDRGEWREERQGQGARDLQRSYKLHPPYLAEEFRSRLIEFFDMGFECDFEEAA